MFPVDGSLLLRRGMGMSADRFISQLHTSLKSGSFLKCTLSKPSRAAGDLRNVFLRPVRLQGRDAVQWTYRHATRDVVKNFASAETISAVKELLGTQFANADLFATDGETSLKFSRRGEPSITVRKARAEKLADLRHNREKHRLLDPSAPWLHRIGITSTDGEVLPSSQPKWRQMNKFLEIVESLVAAGTEAQRLPAKPKIADMGCGKGYLTFALFDFLTRRCGLAPEITGVELRPELVTFCQDAAQDAGMTGLHFRAGSIESFAAEKLHMLIALHACDTATDLALAAGVQKGADILVVSPCCHKQVRRAMTVPPDLAPLLRHGILAERQAEILTDGIRALVLEACGYRTKVFEFISTEHTSKNLMITAVRDSRMDPRHRESARAQVDTLKRLFGVETHSLETALASPPAAN